MSDDLPMGWVDLPLELVGMPSTPNIDPSKFSNEIFELYSVPSYTDDEPEILPSSKIHSTKQSVETGDVLLCKIVPHLNRVWIVKELLQHRQIASGEWIVIRSKIAISDYLRYALTDSTFRSAFMATSSGVGGSLMRARPKAVAQIPIPIAPLNEQRRIVDKLDRIGDRHRTARNELNHIPKLIARYKQAVLAAACSGKLTEDFRLSNSISSVSLSEVCNSITDGDHQAPPKSEMGIPFITISAINDGSLSLNKATRFVPESYFDALSKIRKPEIDDILFTVTGSIGIPVIVDTDKPFVFQRHIAILKANKNVILAKYLLYVLGSEQIQKQALNVATGTAQLTIPLGGLRNFQIQLPPLEEQKEIVRRVEEMFEKIDRMEREYQQAAKLCDRLEQATLAKAFRGELVPQDPHDEPASVLLEQVKQGKSQKEKGKKGK